MVARRSRPLAWASCGFRWTCSSRAGRCTLSTLRWGLCRVTPGSTSRCARRSGAFCSAGGCGCSGRSSLRGRISRTRRCGRSGRGSFARRPSCPRCSSCRGRVRRSRRCGRHWAGSARCRAGGCGAGGSAAYTDSGLRSYTIIRVDVVNITSGLVFVDTRIIEYRRVINSVAINANGQNTHVGRGSIDSPRNGDGFGLPGHAGTCSAGGENGVGHAAGIAVKHDIFNYADIFALRGLDFCTDDFARLNMATAARTRRGLGLSEQGSGGHTQDGKRHSEQE